MKAAENKQQVPADNKDLKKLIGNPKIIFVLGGPCSGKGTQCEKLVEEFGYTHISVGDLMRTEMGKGTKEGDRIKKIVGDGGLVPFELTVQLLINALVATPSKNYLIDGFPRAIDQAQYFEQNVIETQQVLFYDVPQEIMTERCLKRAETSNRSDDNADTIKKRVQNYFDQSLPVVDYYKKFGKVRRIDATLEIGEVYAQTKEAILPQTMFILGPKASGKTMIANNLSERTNMALINFDEYVEKNQLKDEDDEAVTMSLIKSLSQEQKPRVIIENFPQNVFQAKFFLRNCKKPSNVFSLECPKDVCQERMTELGEKNKGYVSSAILSQKIKQYFNSAKELLPFLKSQTNFISMNSDRSFEKTMDEINSHVEPCVIHIRPGANSSNLRKEIAEKLSEKHDFVDLDINGLIRDENERKTAIGLEMHAMVQNNRIIPAEMIVRMLKKIIYSGQPEVNKFILTSFPDIIEQAKEFENNCAKITAIIYSTTNDPIVEIKNNSLSLFNIDSLFQKEFRLKTMCEWNYDVFNEKMGNKTAFGVVHGRSLSGKSAICEHLSKTSGYDVIDMKAVAEKVKASLGTEEEPFEGEVPIKDVEDSISKYIDTKSKGKKTKFVFDGYTHSTPEQFTEFLSKFGLPEFVLYLSAGEKSVKERWCKKNEADDVGEEQAAELKAQEEADKNNKAVIEGSYKDFVGRCQVLTLNTDKSQETTMNELVGLFAPKVIIVTHEKRLGVDTTCANLGIKYNMLYLSAYQIIKQHIEGQTEWGKKLVASKREKNIQLTTQVRDEFNEAEFSAAHFDQAVVMDLLKETIAEKRQNQAFVMLEGLCNSAKLTQEDDRLELRFMDEFFDIERNIGEVKAIIGLQFAHEPESEDDQKTEFEKFPEPEEAPVVQKTNEEGEEAPEEGAEKKAAVFRPELHAWTVTNRKPKNLPQLFLSCKPKTMSYHNTKTAEQFSSSQYEAISRSLDEFCQKAVKFDDNAEYYVYQQIVFTE